MIDRATADELARDWIAAWNSHDLERIFAHYTDDFAMSSPLIAERGFDPSGTLRGKAAIRPYWQAGLAGARPPIHFTLDAVLVGADSIAIAYTNQVGRRVVEVLVLAPATDGADPREARRVIRGLAHYA